MVFDHAVTLLFLFSVLSVVMLTAEILPSVSVTLTWMLVPSVDVLLESSALIASRTAFSVAALLFSEATVAPMLLASWTAPFALVLAFGTTATFDELTTLVPSTVTSCTALAPAESRVSLPSTTSSLPALPLAGTFLNAAVPRSLSFFLSSALSAPAFAPVLPVATARGMFTLPLASFSSLPPLILTDCTALSAFPSDSCVAEFSDSVSLPLAVSPSASMPVPPAISSVSVLESAAIVVLPTFTLLKAFWFTSAPAAIPASFVFSAVV